MFLGVIMNLSRKSKIALAVLAVLMLTASACFAQKWKGIVKGIEGRVGGNGSSQTQAAEENRSSKPAKLSNDPSVQKVAAYLTKSEIALNAKDYNSALEHYNKAAKVKLPSNVAKSDADALNVWSAEIYTRLQYNINIKKRL